MLLVVAGCGVGTQSEPVAIDVPVPTPLVARSPAPVGARTVTVFLIEDDRLAAVERSAPGNGVDRLLEQLLAGPTPPEARSGIRSAVAPISITLVGIDAGTGTVIVEAAEEFTATVGVDQLLAVAQVVWTATEVPGVRQVSITSQGRPLEVPTDDGLSDVPVTREEFETVAPPPDRD